MSRHEFPGKAGATKVMIGWDRPLETFFVQVFRRDPKRRGEEVAFIWEGCDIGEVATAGAAIRIAEPYAALPIDLYAILETDRLRTVATHDGPAQQAIKPLIAKH
jgi:hypothetical protein